MGYQMLEEFGSEDTEQLTTQTGEQRHWVNSFETHNQRKVINWAFLPSVSSLLFCILYHFIGSWPATNGVGMGIYNLHMAECSRWSFPLHQIH